MTTRNFRSGGAALRTGSASLALALALAAAPSFAQDAGISAVPSAAATANDETIVVTGSRIARRDLVSSSPLSVVSDQEFKLTGTVNVEQVLNTLPQVLPGSTSFSNNPGGGVATLNLRGLGSTRNLVLVNGRRWMFFDTSQVVDLNTIPQFLLESVDVVTGGASAVYGSDAISGVVNFRLRNNLVGVEVGTNYAITERGDGARWDSHIAIGSEFADGRGHVTAFGEYYKRKPVFQGARTYSRFALADNATGTALAPGGSATTNSGRFSVPATGVSGPDPDGNGPLLAPTLPRAAGTTFGSALGATFDSPTGATRNYVAADAFNYAPDNYLQVPQERFLYGAYGEYEVNEGATAYLEVTGVNNRVVNQLAATPVTGNFNVSLAAVAPFLSAADNAALATIDANETAINAARAATGLTPLFTGAAAPANAAGTIQLGVARRVTETGTRNSLDERNAFRVLAGVKGNISDSGFGYDAYYSYARTRNANVQEGNISRAAFQNGLNGTAPAIDIFGPGSLSPASVAQISILAQNNDISVLQVASASVNGSLFNFGMGGDDVGIAFGGEYRSVSSRFIPDTALSSGDVIGFNAGNPTGGSYTVKDVFAEIRIPVIADKPLFHRLELTGAGRYSKYSLDSVGGVYTYAGGAEWSPIADITFRGNYQRAIRAPNVGELFGGTQVGSPSATDPCTTPAALVAGGLRNTCIATGVPAANLGLGIPSALQPNSQVTSTVGGNPNLTAEKSDSYTFGAVVRPSFIPGLNVTVDYFNIKIGNAILTAGGGPANILNLCYNQFQDATNGFCQLITRNPATGALDGTVNANGTASIFAGAANLSTFKTDGIDFQVDYSMPINYGLMGPESKLNFFFLGTYTKHNTTVPVNGVTTGSGAVIECAGKFGLNCGNPQGKYKWTSRLAWIDGPLTSTFRWRHISKTRDDDDATDFVVESIKAFDYFDLAFSFDINDAFTVSAGVNNLLDKQPPILGSNQEQANTYSGTFDPLGRDYFISASFRF